MRQYSDQATMRLQFEAEFAPEIQGQIKTWYHNLLKSIADLKLAERIIPLVAVIKQAIGQVVHTLRFTELDRLRNQSVARPLVIVTMLGRQAQDRRHLAPIHEFQEADRFFTHAGDDEVTTVHKRRVILAHPLQTFSIVHVANPLSDRRVVVDIADAFDQVVVKRLDGDSNAPPLRPSHILASFLGKFLPPLLEARQFHRSHALPLHRILVLRSLVGQFLSEGEDVCANASPLLILEGGSAQFRLARFRNQPFLIVHGCDLQPSSVSDQGLSVHFNHGNVYPLTPGDYFNRISCHSCRFLRARRHPHWSASIISLCIARESD
ncbi:MAG: hypothetical protein ABSF66_00120 [Terriglobales bacterium]